MAACCACSLRCTTHSISACAVVIHRSSTARPVDVLVANFEAAYNGNRAPFPIYIRTPWLRTGQHLRGLQLFAGGWCCCAGGVVDVLAVVRESLQLGMLLL